MNNKLVKKNRPDIKAARRGGDNKLGMTDEVAFSKASLKEALYWQGIYTEISIMEDSVLSRIKILMEQLSPTARQEVELTNIPVVEAQAAKFRERLAFWTVTVEARKLVTPGNNWGMFT